MQVAFRRRYTQRTHIPATAVSTCTRVQGLHHPHTGTSGRNTHLNLDSTANTANKVNTAPSHYDTRTWYIVPVRTIPGTHSASYVMESIESTQRHVPGQDASTMIHASTAVQQYPAYEYRVLTKCILVPATWLLLYHDYQDNQERRRGNPASTCAASEL